MTRNSRLRIIGVLFLVLILIAGISIVGTAQAAQDDTPEPEPEPEPPEDVYGTLGDLWILDVDYDREAGTAEITVEWQGDRPEDVVFTQIDPDAGKAAIEQLSVRPEQKVRINIDLVSDANGLLYTQASINRQRAEVIQFEENTARSTSLLRGLIYGASTFAIGTFGMAWRRVNTFGKPQKGWQK